MGEMKAYGMAHWLSVGVTHTLLSPRPINTAFTQKLSIWWSSDLHFPLFKLPMCPTGKASVNFLHILCARPLYEDITLTYNKRAISLKFLSGLVMNLPRIQYIPTANQKAQST